MELFHVKQPHPFRKPPWPPRTARLYLGIVMVSKMESSVSWRLQLACTPALFIMDSPRVTVLRNSRTSLITKVGFFGRACLPDEAGFPHTPPSGPQ